MAEACFRRREAISLKRKRKLEGNKPEVETATRDRDGTDESRHGTNKKAARSAGPDNGDDSLPDDGVPLVGSGSSEHEMTAEHKTPSISGEVSEDEPWVGPHKKNVVRIRSLAGDIITEPTYRINRNPRADPTLGNIRAHAVCHL